jgi:mannose-6-phosphate isomerase-like protein (cupin superfamily)
MAMIAFVGPVEKLTLENTYFRQVLCTGEHSQLVVMCLAPGEEIGDEVHPSVNQFFRIEAGEAKFVLNKKQEHLARDGDAVVVPSGTYHNVINTSKTVPLKLYTIYSPPNHPAGTVHKTKADAEAAEALEHKVEQTGSLRAHPTLTLMETITMHFVRVTSTAALLLLLGTLVPAYAQHEEKGEKQAKPQQQQHAQQPQQARPQQQARPAPQQQARPAPQQRVQQTQQARPQQQARPAPQQRVQQTQQARPQQQARPAPQQQVKQSQQARPQQQARPATQQRVQQTQQARPQQQQRVQQTQQARPQQQQRVQQTQQARPQQQQRVQQTQQARPQQQQRQQQQPVQQAQQQRQQQYQPQQRTRQQAVAWQQQRSWAPQGSWQPHSNWQQGRSQNWGSDHRDWGQRGGYGGYYISQSIFSISFGNQHWFRMHNRPYMYMGYPRFSYGGYSFLLLDPWPYEWGDNWYNSDDVYIDYDNGYYLHNRRYPGFGLAVSVVM